ncbi:CBS domain-containing protein [Methanofervidicoccus sp. A16]|uniref:CBS domain-containing protein n=1 Tax=Methanofervidicoccus sp. A16 TaxID=2607662 RepID=UPI00118D3D5E|nr:CBS domain-containing protein [Methanofervidicoccus sp. A16]AXI25510.1 CBS domain-containing protein [Methanofervidicoccus sp. A16]
MKVRELMDTNFLKLYKDYSVKEAIQLMYKKKRFSAPVLDDEDKLVGLVLSVDLAVVEDRSIPISEVMYPYEEVVTVRENDPARDAVIKLVKYKVISIPVLNEEDRVVGVVRSCDVIKTLAKLYDIPVYKLFKILEKELKGITWEELMEAAAIVTKNTTGEDITPEEYEKRIRNTTFGQALWACGGLEKFFAGLIKIGEVVIARRVAKFGKRGR